MIGKFASINPSRIESMIAVSAKPGQMPFTRMPSAAWAGPRARTIPTTAALFAP
jgi:hypothetical protein